MALLPPLTRDDPRPLATRIAEAVRWFIETELSAGDALPSVKALCTRYDASPATVGEAVERLERDGLVYSVPRQGVFAREQHPGSLMVRLTVDELDALRRHAREQGTPMGAVARRAIVQATSENL